MSDPSLEQRLRARLKPERPPAMFQRWDDLLFLHWAWNPIKVQASLPKGLTVDTFEGQAWMGIVPFWMNAVRPRRLPALPWLSHFLELNLRTYVHDEQGNPRVWFYSLDYNQPIATAIARRFFGLNYVHAQQTGSRSDPPEREFRSICRSTKGESHFKWSPEGSSAVAPPGGLEFFLVERYRLFSQRNGHLYRGQVWHEPYAISAAKIDLAETTLWVDQNWSQPNRAPDHTMTSAGVSVSIYPLQLAR